MDNNNWRVAQGQMAPGPPQGQVAGGGEVVSVQAAGPASAAMDAGDWRTQLQSDSRQRIVNKIMDTLKKHLPFSGHEGLQELKKIAVRFEEKIYAASTSQSDYLRKISMKLLTMETRPQPMANSMQSNSASGRAPSDHASLDSTAQTGNANGGDWQEEVFQKIKSMKEMYFLELNDLLLKAASRLQPHDSLPQQPKNEPLEKLRSFKVLLERLVAFLRSNKQEIGISHKDKLPGVERQIISILNSNRPRSRPLQQGQLPQSQMPAMHPYSI